MVPFFGSKFNLLFLCCCCCCWIVSVCRRFVYGLGNEEEEEDEDCLVLWLCVCVLCWLGVGGVVALSWTKSFRGTTITKYIYTQKLNFFKNIYIKKEQETMRGHGTTIINLSWLVPAYHGSHPHLHTSNLLALGFLTFLGVFFFF